MEKVLDLYSAEREELCSRFAAAGHTRGAKYIKSLSIEDWGALQIKLQEVLNATDADLEALCIEIAEFCSGLIPTHGIEDVGYSLLHVADTWREALANSISSEVVEVSEEELKEVLHTAEQLTALLEYVDYEMKKKLEEKHGNKDREDRQ